MELKPCPCCGSKAELSYEEAYSVDSSYSYVGCIHCDLRIPYLDVQRQEEYAIEKWNRRT